MTIHLLQGRREDELIWFQRRDTLKAAAAWVAMGGLPAALAQQRSNVVELVGDVLLNGQRLDARQTIQTGDEIVSGPASRLIFLIPPSPLYGTRSSSIRPRRKGWSTRPS